MCAQTLLNGSLLSAALPLIALADAKLDSLRDKLVVDLKGAITPGIVFEGGELAPGVISREHIKGLLAKPGTPDKG